ncbi:MAG: polysaccharide biosynthesis/export family protein [Verrucomicrobiota bacterium]
MTPVSPSAAFPSPDPSGGAVAVKVKSLLPFDILRVGLKLAEGWRGVILIAILGSAAGCGAGWFLLRNKYTVQVQLVRREMPNTFQASEIGESFRPRQFTSATVMSLMVASSMAEKTGSEMTPPVDAAELLRRIELRPDKNTELITVAYTSRDSPQRAAAELNLYAGNVVKLLEDLQAQEARELLAFLSDQATRTQTSLNQALLDLQSFSRETGLTDPARETDSLLRQVGELDLKIEMAGISRETTAFRIQQTEKELARQDPAMQRLQEAKNQLAELMVQYTAQNPFVIDQQAKVRALEEKAGKPGAADSFQSTGNAVANSLYLDLIHLRAEQDTAITEQQKLQAFRDGLRQRLDTIPDKSILNARLRGVVTSLETTRDLLAGRQREAQLFAEKALGYYRIFSPATPESMEKAGRSRKIILLGMAGGILAAGFLLAVRALRAAMNDALVSPSDLRRVVGVRIAAMLPPENTLTPEELGRWRFSAWAEIVKLAAPPPEGALIAGFIAATAGEGKTTWLRHLSTAALERGLKVLIIFCEIPVFPGPVEELPPEAGPVTGESPQAGISPALPAEEPALEHGPVFPLQEALRNPGKILEILRSPQSPALSIGPDAGFVWTPEWRALWRAALEIWSREPALAVLVELPPASRMDSLLLAETLPALFWLSGSGQLRRRDITPALDTIRGSGLPLTASLLNRVPPVFLKLPDLAKFGLCLTAGFLMLTDHAAAQTVAPVQKGPAAAPQTPAPGENPASTPDSLIPANPPAVSLSPADGVPVSPDDAAAGPGDRLPQTRTPLSTEEPPSLDTLPDGTAPMDAQNPPASAVAPPPVLPPAAARPRPPAPPPARPVLAPWQQQLTLGPGDSVNLHVYGQKQHTRTDVPIGPDGRLTYLQVIGFPAGGLTIDQLRDGLTKALGAYIQNARVIVTPGAWRSKKYYMLGTVVDRGVFTLDRPMTLMEAAARARGMETGYVDETTVEISDMKRAFLVRDGKRLPVDFAGLFYDGDMSQNIQLQPGDYIYFPSSTVNEVYVLGSVGSPGTTGVTQNLSVIAAITIRGGFARTAWKKKVLIVRGSLEKPQVIVVDAAAILSGKQRDVLLEPLDLVYVTDKPWKYAAEILDTALKTFVQSAASSWAGDQIQPFIGNSTPN